MFSLVVFQVQIDTVDSSDSGPEGTFAPFVVCVEAISSGGATSLQVVVTVTITVDMSGKAGALVITVTLYMRMVLSKSNTCTSLLQMLMILNFRHPMK